MDIFGISFVSRHEIIYSLIFDDISTNQPKPCGSLLQRTFESSRHAYELVHRVPDISGWSLETSPPIHKHGILFLSNNLFSLKISELLSGKSHPDFIPKYVGKRTHCQMARLIGFLFWSCFVKCRTSGGPPCH